MRPLKHDLKYQLERIEAKLDLLLASQRLTRRLTMATWEDVRAKITANRSVTESAVVLLQELHAKLSEAGVPDELLTELEANTAALANAVAANTPARNEPPVEEPPTPTQLPA